MQRLSIMKTQNNTIQNHQVMKTFHKITRKITLVAGIVMGALIVSTSLVQAASEKKPKNDKTYEATVAELEMEILEYLQEEEDLIAEFKALNLPTIKIFDANDELVFQATVDDINTIKDKKLRSLLYQSDFLMSFENTSYYKLHN